jgi:uncharacterized protein (TIGR03435 family)
MMPGFPFSKSAGALLTLAWASANPQSARPTFEVATVRLSTTDEGAYSAGGPGSKDPTQFTFVRARLGTLLRRAYSIKPFQLIAPAGLPDAYFDVHARVPPGTSEPEFEEMLRTLLVERFGLKAHQETRDMSGYELSVAAGGPRLKPAEATAEPPPPDVPVGRLPLIRDRGGEMQLPPGRNALLVLRLSDGRFRQSGRMQSMADIVEMCTRELGRPVVDRTGLSGVYDFNIDFMRPPDEPTDSQTDADVPFLTAIQAQLGLRFTAKKIPATVVIVDHINKIPTDN